MQQKDNSKFFLLFFITFLTSFLLGIVFSFSIANDIKSELLKNNPNYGIDELLIGDSPLDMKKFWEVYTLVKNNNYGLDEVKKDDLVDGAIKGLVDALGDTHTEFLNTEETTKFNQILSGDFEGIGAIVKKNEFGILIDMVLKGSPAKKYGLQKGDIVIKADGIELANMDLYDAIDKIKGPAGTKVLLDVLRKTEQEILQIEVTRDKIKIPSIDSRVIDDLNVGYISINRFGQETSAEFKEALDNLGDTQGIIIDLRDNGGGYLLSAVEILSEFIEKGEVLVETRERNSLFNSSYKSLGSEDLYDKKVVVIINENSASASEIMAGALKEYNKAIVIGVKSYGKGSVQKPFELDDGSLLKLTVAKWFTPKGVNIDKDGINPDINVELKVEDFENNFDRQFDIAKKTIIEFINIDSIGLVVEKINSSLE